MPLTVKRDTEKEAEIVWLYLEMRSYNQVSRVVGISPQRVAEIYHRWHKENPEEQVLERT